MKIFTHTIESTLAEQIDTEIRFVIASARACGKELIHFKFKTESAGKFDEIAIKQLRAIKKQGKIDFFASEASFSENNAEASYLKNKFPEVADLIGSENSYFIVKI